jgi:hypothetical protein
VVVYVISTNNGWVDEASYLMSASTGTTGLRGGEWTEATAVFAGHWKEKREGCKVEERVRQFLIQDNLALHRGFIDLSPGVQTSLVDR